MIDQFVSWRPRLRPLALSALLLTPAGMFAQGTTASVVGTVTDASGAVVPGAIVTVTQVETNAVHTVTSSEAGTYTVPQLPPGTYVVRVTKADFKTYQRDNLTLVIDQTAQVDAKMEIGGTGETVVVSSTPPVIQTDDSSIGSVVDSQAIQNTPLNGRLSVIGLITLAPGVQGVGAQDQLATRGVTPAFGSSGRNAYGDTGTTLDGVKNEEVALQRSEPEVPSLDAIAEFKVISNGAPAEFQQSAQIIVASASGTNKLHGEGFEFNRSKGTSAKAYFGGASPRPPYERNEYGGNLSGPVYLPHLYNGKDKSFFFVAYEGFRLTQSYTSNTQQPTLLERQGDFSEGCHGTTIVNPATGLPFPGNRITTPLSAVDQQLLNILFAKPTQSGCGVNTFEQIPETSISKRTSVRMDHRLTSADQLRFTYLGAYYGPNPTSGNTILQGGNAADGEHDNIFILGWTHTFSPTLLVDSVGSYLHLPIYRTPQNYQTDFSSIIPGLGPQLIEGAPQISITNVSGVGEAGGKSLDQVVQFNSAVTKVTAKHTIKFGGSFLLDNYWNNSAQSPSRGQYNFNGHYTGSALADFLLGYPSSTSKPLPSNFLTRNFSTQWGLYVQDNWKPIEHLTINAGLRYDVQWFYANGNGNNSLYVPSLKKVVVFGNAYPSNAIPNFLTSIPIDLSTHVGLPENIFDYLGRAPKNVAPRLGFAYEFKPDTVIRGAFGIYYNLFSPAYVENSAFGNLPFLATENYTNSTGATPAFTMDSGPFSATGSFTSNPSVYAQAKTQVPYAEQYNLSMEHQFRGGVDLRVGYVGQHNVKMNNYGGGGNVAPNINLANPPVVGVSAQTTNLVQPFSSILLELDPVFHSTENSLQVGVHKRYNSGFSIGAEYQWTRVLGTENFENPSGANVNDSYGPIGGIAPQVLTVNYSYTLPFGHGRAFLGTANSLVDKIVNGWQVSGITIFQDGQPFSVGYSAPGTPVGLVSGRANVVPGVPLYPATKTRQRWFNPAAFAAPPTYTSGGVSYATYGNSGYNMLRGPGYQNWDMNLEKNILFRERYRVQLRADSFNVFNHPNFGTPNASISNASTIGTITSTSGTPGYEQRTVEFAAKFAF